MTTMASGREMNTPPPVRPSAMGISAQMIVMLTTAETDAIMEKTIARIL